MDLRRCINLISDVVNNRPMPIREFDQIYMKHADMLLQIEHISKWFMDKRVIFIGDGDAIALCLAHLQKNEEIDGKIKQILVLDFDQRIVNSINRFAEKNNMTNIISARLYNVAAPLPRELWHNFDCFHCNPPFGSKNNGASIISFMRRGFEATGDNALGCVVVADAPEQEWVNCALHNTQKFALENSFVISEMIPKFHSYHLDDDPNLRSCSIVLRRIDKVNNDYESIPLEKEYLERFYGINNPLIHSFVKDCSNRQSNEKDYDLILLQEDLQYEYAK